MKSILLSSLFLFSSCGLLIKKIDSPIVEKSVIYENREKKATYCSMDESPRMQLVGSNKSSQESYLKFSSKLKNIDVIDHLVLWSLVQLSLRPDQSSPTARLQTLINYKDKAYYFDFFSESDENQYPYFYGLEWILKKFKKTTSLESYAAILENNFKDSLRVSPDLERFLLKNQELIKINTTLAPHYFRGTDVLRENESTPRINLRKVIAEYRKQRKKQNIIINTTLHKFATNKGYVGECNYDFNLYSNSIFLIDKTLPVSNIYGLSLGNDAFLNSSSQIFKEAHSLFGGPLFKGSSQVRSSAICSIENKGTKIWTISNESRDPGQHLFHLIKYGLPLSTSVDEVDKLFKHSRHLFLSDPIRLVIESNRSDQQQIQNLLKLSVPIYHADKLGNIWGYVQTKDKDSRFIVDERNNGDFVCK
ncbi:MAG: hypothetical protein WDA09_08910 [Bacteriovoracaceae bacterium]